MDKIVFTSTSELRELIDNSIRMAMSQPKETKKYDSSQQLISRKEAAAMLRISLPTLDRRIKEGILKSYIVGNKILLKREEIQSSLEERFFKI